MDMPEGDGPERTCIATRRALPVDRLIRFVAAPDGSVVPDLKRKLPGRGVWVTARHDAVAEAVRRKAFARAFKTAVIASPALADEVGALLRRSALAGLSLANKAGAVIAGTAKIEGSAKRGYAALFHAASASPAGTEKLERAVRMARRDGRSVPQIRLFTAEELSVSLGREHVIHAALVAGAPAGLALSLARAAQDYWRTDPAPTPSPDPVGKECVDTCISIKDSAPDE